MTQTGTTKWLMVKVVSRQIMPVIVRTMPRRHRDHRNEAIYFLGLGVIRRCVVSFMLKPLYTPSMHWIRDETWSHSGYYGTE